VTTPMQRAVGAGVVAVALWGGAQLAYAAWLCPPHRRWSAATGGTRTVVVERGERRARDGDAVWVCETPHDVGPIRLHFDLDCHCAPQTVSVDEIQTRVHGTCTLDGPLAGVSRCADARCNHYVR
jgi:hypothetical protein